MRPINASGLGIDLFCRTSLIGEQSNYYYYYHGSHGLRDVRGEMWRCTAIRCGGRKQKLERRFSSLSETRENTRTSHQRMRQSLIHSNDDVVYFHLNISSIRLATERQVARISSRHRTVLMSSIGLGTHTEISVPAVLAICLIFWTKRYPFTTVIVLETVADPA